MDHPSGPPSPASCPQEWPMVLRAKTTTQCSEVWDEGTEAVKLPWYAIRQKQYLFGFRSSHGFLIN